MICDCSHTPQVLAGIARENRGDLAGKRTVTFSRSSAQPSLGNPRMLSRYGGSSGKIRASVREFNCAPRHGPPIRSLPIRGVGKRIGMVSPMVRIGCILDCS